MSPIVPATLFLKDGTPYSTAFDDVYFSTEGGLEQARHVFLAGNDLPARWRDRHGFTILETGFGSGLSFLATWQAWREDPARSAHLDFVSTEIHPFGREDLATLHARWPALAELAAELQQAWPPLTPGFHRLLLDGGRVTLTLLLGDARTTLPQLRCQADALFLDGFAPQRNPELWSAEFLALLTRLMRPGATLASWCVSGEVRTALKACGWALRKTPGYAHKWQMLRGSLPTNSDSAEPDPPHADDASRHAIVIGAGIAGCATTAALARRGWKVTLIEKHAGPASEASGNPQGLLHPMLARDDNLAARFSRAAYLHTLRLLHTLAAEGLLSAWEACGILELAENDADAAEKRETLARNGFDPDYVRWLDIDAATAQAGQAVAHGGAWFPQAAWVSPPDLCQALLAEAGPATTLFSRTVAAIEHIEGQWHALDGNGQAMAQAPVLILANAEAARLLLPDTVLGLRRIRGQITYLPAKAVAGLKVALCGRGYVAPPHHGMATAGASFVEDDPEEALRAAEHAENLERLAALLPQAAGLPDPSLADGRVAFRTATHDRLPLIGPLPDKGIRPGHTLNSLPRQPGLFALLGLGSRGLIWGPMGAEMLAAHLDGAPSPVETDLQRALDAGRHALRHVRKTG